jgi:hypothetical protein
VYARRCVLKRSFLCVLVVLALVLGAGMVACGGGGDKSNEESGQPTAEQQQDNGDNSNQEEAATPEEKSSDNKASGSFADVPLYPGVDEITTGEFSGSDAGIPGISGDLNPEDYSSVEYGLYETSDDPEDVYNWYKDNMDGWDEQGSFSGGSDGDYGAYAIWSKDDGKTAAWITISMSDDLTNLGIWVATQ